MHSDIIEQRQTLQRQEVGEPDTGERAWLAWMGKAEALALRVPECFRFVEGKPDFILDGDEPSGDTFSIDSAYAAFERETSPEAYVADAVGRWVIGGRKPCSCL